MRRWTRYSLLADTSYVCPSCRHQALRGPRIASTRPMHARALGQQRRYASAEKNNGKSSNEKVTQETSKNEGKSHANGLPKAASHESTSQVPGKPPAEKLSKTGIQQTIYEFFKGRKKESQVSQDLNSVPDSIATDTAREQSAGTGQRGSKSEGNGEGESKDELRNAPQPGLSSRARKRLNKKKRGQEKTEANRQRLEQQNLATKKRKQEAELAKAEKGESHYAGSNRCR